MELFLLFCHKFASHRLTRSLGFLSLLQLTAAENQAQQVALLITLGMLLLGYIVLIVLSLRGKDEWLHGSTVESDFWRYTKLLWRNKKDYTIGRARQFPSTDDESRTGIEMLPPVDAGASAKPRRSRQSQSRSSKGKAAPKKSKAKTPNLTDLQQQLLFDKRVEIADGIRRSLKT